MAFVPPSPADKATLLTLGSDIVNSWYSGTVDEYYDPATRIWKWNAAETGNDNDWDQRLGLSALCAALYRYQRPRNLAQRQLYRRLAIETIDQWFTNQQDPVTGGIWRTSLANLVADSGTVTFFGLMQVAIVAKLLNLRTRWATQIGRALDYTTSRNELGYYTNGNIMFLKLIGYELGAWATGDAARRTQVETLWYFTVDPQGQQLSVGNVDRWRGCGLRTEPGGKGWFSETTSTGNSIDHTGSNVLDWVYTNAQAEYSALGYLLFNDPRYATYAAMCVRKMDERNNYSTNQFDFSGGTRNVGPGVRNITGLAHMAKGWVDGEEYFRQHCSGIINNATQGLDVDFRRYLNVSHQAFVRGFGTNIAGAIMAAHGRLQ